MQTAATCQFSSQPEPGRRCAGTGGSRLFGLGPSTAAAGGPRRGAPGRRSLPAPAAMPFVGCLGCPGCPGCPGFPPHAGMQMQMQPPVLSPCTSRGKQGAPLLGIRVGVGAVYAAALGPRRQNQLVEVPRRAAHLFSLAGLIAFAGTTDPGMVPEELDDPEAPIQRSYKSSQPLWQQAAQKKGYAPRAPRVGARTRLCVPRAEVPPAHPKLLSGKSEVRSPWGSLQAVGGGGEGEGGRGEGGRGEGGRGEGGRGGGRDFGCVLGNPGYDHYCRWLCNSIGLYNHRAARRKIWRGRVAMSSAFGLAA